MQKSLCNKDNIWWNSELAGPRKQARQAWRKAIKKKTRKRLGGSKSVPYLFFKKAVRRAKRDLWRSFVESLKGHSTQILKNCKIILTNMFANMTP